MRCPAPDLAIVIAATHSRAAVARTLESLERDDPRVEVIVVTAGFPAPDGVPSIEAPATCGVPRLRRLGLDATRGAAVVFTEDSCTCDAGWVEAWRQGFADPTLNAATGPVSPAIRRRLDWAVFFCEYAVFLPRHASETPANRLAGNNFGMRREVADRLDPTEIHESELAGAGGSLRWIPDTTVYHVRTYGAVEAFRDRFRFGRDYGRRRASGLPRNVRTARLDCRPGGVRGPGGADHGHCREAPALLRRVFLGVSAHTRTVVGVESRRMAGLDRGRAAFGSAFSATTWKSGPIARVSCCPGLVLTTAL